MRQNRVQKMQVHWVPPPDGASVAECVNRFHVQIIQHRIDQLDWTSAEKMELIDSILHKIKTP